MSDSGEPIQLDVASLLSESNQITFVIEGGQITVVDDVVMLDKSVVDEEVVIADNCYVLEEVENTVENVTTESIAAVVPEVVRGDVQTVHTCLICKRQYRTEAALASHCQSTHGPREDQHKPGISGENRLVRFSAGQEKAGTSGHNLPRKVHIVSVREKKFITRMKHTETTGASGAASALSSVASDQKTVKTVRAEGEAVVLSGADGVWQCMLCPSVILDDASWAEHQKMHGGIRDRKDEVVVEETGEYTEVKMLPNVSENVEVRNDEVRVVLVKRETNQYDCPACDFTATNRKHLGAHIHKQHPGQELLQCDDCGEKFHSMKRYTTHLVQNHGDSHPCESCGKKFTSRANLRKHTLAHCSVIVCEECGVSCQNRLEYNAHRKCHQTVTCDICLKQFSNKYNLDTHMARLHGQVREGVVRNIKRYYDKETRSDPCPVCGKTYCNDRVLKMHMKEHSGEYDFQCDQCGKSFHHRTSLKWHMELHENLAYPCSKCSRVFRRKNSLHTHERSVHGQKRHQCEFCNRKFATTEHLRAHRRTHTGEKPYSCKYCSQAFAQVATLQNHVRNIHDKIKPYKCDRCEEDFNRPGQLEQHLQKYHGGSKSFQCVVCKEIFKTVRALKMHLLEKHMDEMTSDSESDDEN